MKLVFLNRPISSENYLHGAMHMIHRSRMDQPRSPRPESNEDATEAINIDAGDVQRCAGVHSDSKLRTNANLGHIPKCTVHLQRLDPFNQKHRRVLKLLNKKNHVTMRCHKFTLTVIGGLRYDKTRYNIF